jgi:CheY-like chemotaxis protein
VNKQVKVLVVEDEYITAKLIAEYLEKNNYSIVGIAVSIDEALDYLKKEIHLIILDINLNEERDGIWLANHINCNYNIPFVFLTAYSDRVTISKAIETDPYNYLIKLFKNQNYFLL